MMRHEDRVLLVDEDDRPVGEMDKLAAHTQGVLHRAFSVFVFNSDGGLLLQKRAQGKYHSGGLWSNTCCSHPRVGEKVMDAAKRRLIEEMGLDADLTHMFVFIYRAKLGGGMIEHELDHVFSAQSDSPPQINTDEVSDWRFARLDEIRDELTKRPESFTIWFRLSFEQVFHLFENDKQLALDT